MHRVKRAMFEKMGSTGVLAPERANEETARKKVQAGDVGVAVVIPPNFSRQLAAAMTGGPKPKLQFLTDPTQSTTYLAARGVVTQAAMQAVMTGSSTGGNMQEGDGLPFESENKSVAKDDEGEKWGGTRSRLLGNGCPGPALWRDRGRDGAHA